MSKKRNANTPEGYEIGYGRPPKSSQWRKGQSGNPRGRPKGNVNFETAMREILTRTVSVRENGKVRKIYMIEAIVTKILQNALNGDIKSIRLALELLATYKEPSVLRYTPPAPDATDQNLADAYAKMRREAQLQIQKELDANRSKRKR